MMVNTYQLEGGLKSNHWSKRCNFCVSLYDTDHYQNSVEELRKQRSSELATGKILTDKANGYNAWLYYYAEID